MKVGGQAVMEGVMMRSPNSFAVAVRRSNGEIVVREAQWKPLLAGWRILRWPFLRGTLVLLESLINGISALNFSARIAMADLEKEEAAKKEAAEKDAVAKGDKPAEVPVSEMESEKLAPGDSAPAEQAGELDVLEEANKDVSDWVIWGTVIFSLGLGIGLFIALPHLVVWGASQLLGYELTVEHVTFHAIVGVVKLGVFLGYISLISLMADVRRVFQFHGSEHQSIYTFEAGEPLTVEAAREHSPLHPRCGTTFLIMVILLSILVFALIFPLLIWLLGEPTGIAWVDQIIYILTKLPLLFPIAGLAYEFQRLTSRFLDRGWARGLAWPGMFVQRLTTRPPDDDQLEVALTSLRKVLWRERVGAGEGGTEPKVEVFADYQAAVEGLGGPS